MFGLFEAIKIIYDELPKRYDFPIFMCCGMAGAVLSLFFELWTWQFWLSCFIVPIGIRAQFYLWWKKNGDAS